MLRLNDAQRAILVQAVPAVANLGLGALVFGQFLRQQPFPISFAGTGIALWFVLISFTISFAGGKR